jgi:type II secretory pathway component PulF
MIVIGLSKILSQGWIYLVVAVLICVLVYRRWIDTQQGQYQRSLLVMALPVIGDVLVKTDLARFCRTIVLLINNSVTLVQALQVAIPVVHNEVLKEQLTKARNELIAGGSLADSLKRSPGIPVMMVQMISVAEEAGNLEMIFNEMAEMSR